MKTREPDPVEVTDAGIDFCIEQWEAESKRTMPYSPGLMTGLRWSPHPDFVVAAFKELREYRRKQAGTLTTVVSVPVKEPIAS